MPPCQVSSSTFDHYFLHHHHHHNHHQYHHHQHYHCDNFRIKKAWKEASLPLKSDKDIIDLLAKLKKTFDYKKKAGLANIEDYVIKIKKTTLNLAPADWEKRIRWCT